MRMERPEEFFTIRNLDTSQTCSTSKRKKKKSNNVNKRRFSDEQIRSLESMFCSSDSKLDSSKKVQLATELGLQPRQIAIWFQNRRARCKSKQMENDFRSLIVNYENLASQFKTLKEENIALLSQVRKLSELVQGHYELTYENQENQENLESESGENRVEYLNNHSKKYNREDNQEVQVKELLEGNINHISDTEQVCQLLNTNGSYESSENWRDFESDGVAIFDYQSSTSLEGPSFWD